MNQYLPEEILNTRPLVFLCGPYFDEHDTRDRRRILRIYLGNVDIEIDKIHVVPFALIIDNLLSTTQDPLPADIKLGLLEEIIAACAYKNYVFVDSMSTALELGLFSSSYSQNYTTAFIPSDYKLFNPSIGDFFKKTIEESRNISECVYIGKRNNKYVNDTNGNPIKVYENLIGFKGKSLPKAIQNQITQDFPSDLKNYTIKMSFSDQLTDNSKIIYQINGDNLNFVVPPTILLYLVFKYREIKDIQEILMSYFFFYYSKSFEKDKTLLIMYRRGILKIKIDTPFNEKSLIVIKHFSYLIEKISKSSPQKYKKLEYEYKNYTSHGNDLSFLDLFGFSESESREAKNLVIKISRATRRKHITINGKSRKITMYAGNYEGFQLRQLNTKIISTLESLVVIHPRAFAYRKNHSTVQCVQQHINSSYFLKIDIHDFFGSISKRIMKQMLRIQLSKDPELSFFRWQDSRRNAIRRRYQISRKVNQSVLIDKWEGLTSVLGLCFVNGHLPLGLTSSPCLSNIYMYFFDNWITRKYPNLVYTRYSDDMLISSEEMFNYNEILEAIKRELKILNLTINERKTQNLHLSENGDHIKFLGLNIIRQKGKNNISVGKRYIKDTCLLFSQQTSESIRNCSQETIGKIKYIKHISEQDYDYLKKLYEIKNHKNPDVFDKIYK